MEKQMIVGTFRIHNRVKGVRCQKCGSYNQGNGVYEGRDDLSQLRLCPQCLANETQIIKEMAGRS